MRVIARRTLVEYAESLRGSKDFKALKSSLEAWFHEVQEAEWKSPVDVKRSYGNASLVGEDRVVFNIKGNEYRLVVAIDYVRRIVFIKWIGTHKQYDGIDVRKVSYGDQAHKR
jgi:mRNA interferase HigB